MKNGITNLKHAQESVTKLFLFQKIDFVIDFLFLVAEEMLFYRRLNYFVIPIGSWQHSIAKFYDSSSIQREDERGEEVVS